MERQSCVLTGASIVRNPDLHRESQCPVCETKKKHQPNTHGGLLPVRHYAMLSCVVGVMSPFVLAEETAVLGFCQELESLFQDKQTSNYHNSLKVPCMGRSMYGEV